MKNLFLFSLFSIFIFGCGGSGGETENYKNPAFDGYLIKTIAVFPIQNSELDQKEKEDIDGYFFTGISKKQSKFTFLSPSKNMKQLSKDNLENMYNAHLEAYSTTGRQNVETLKEIGNSLKCDAIYQGRIYDIIKEGSKITATVKYTLFSTLDGKKLLEASSTTDKKKFMIVGRTPTIVEVVKIAIEDIVTDLHDMQ